ncbi:MAG: hypothetical protein QOH93_52 [Chloroflexia bacterium]|nr:hypothetical protein [Chloroflexia bacterium]
MRTLPDDAFYYFQTARHIAAGDGSTFDGLHPTNGYHPLWMLLLVPLATAAQDPVALTRLALALSILCAVLSATLLYLLLRRLTGIWWVPPLGAGLYFLNAQAIVSNLNGLETSLSTLLFVTSVYLVAHSTGKRQTRRQAVLLGLILGLLFLARTDNVFYIATLLLVVLVREWKSEKAPSIRTLAGVAAKPGIAITVAAAIIAPWLAWNLVNLGSIIQTSGFAVPYLLQESYRLEGHTGSEFFQHSLGQFLSFLRLGFFNFLAMPALLFVPAAVLSAIVLGYTWRNRDRSYEQRDWRSSLASSGPLRAASGLVLALWVGGIVLVFVHTFVRWNPRDWYFDQMIALSALTFCLALVALNPGETITQLLQLVLRRWAPRISEDIPALATLRRIVSVAGTIALASLLLVPLALGSMRLWNGIYPHQVEFLDAAQWLKANTQPGEISAGFNSGITGFFSDRAVVNLDGVMDNAAYPAITKKDLAAFMKQSQVRYYVDFDPQMFDLYSEFLGPEIARVKLVPLAAFERPDIQWYHSAVRVYRLDWHD